MSLVRFREWLFKQSQNDQSIDFWRIRKRRKDIRNIRNISNIRIQGNIYTALVFFFEQFEGCNVPFLENTTSIIENIEKEYCEYSEYSQYSRLVENIEYGYDDNDISICLVDIKTNK